ncbi:MAG: CAP domain-containing protein [Oscillospiraceae bacterium]|nr:CAP domain-containing protein [Oscillospiraceae bacterium]
MKQSLYMLIALVLATSLVACATYAISDVPEPLEITQEDFEIIQAERDAYQIERDVLAAELGRMREEAAARETTESETEEYEYDVYEYGGADEVDVQEPEPTDESTDVNITPETGQQAQPALPTQSTQQPASPTPQVQPQQTSPGTATNGTGVFTGVNVTVNDTTTVATTSGMPGLRATVFNFLSADGRILGSISMDDYMRIMERNGIQDGGERWFADEFNRFRGLIQSAGEAAAEANADRQERYRRELIRLVNIERERAGLHPYTMNQDLMRFSQVRAQELSVQFSHTRPDGTHSGFEVAHAGSTNPENAVRAWMNSTGHRAQLLDHELNVIGVGVYINQSGRFHWQMYFDFDDLRLIQQTSLW